MDSCICSEGIRFLEATWRAVMSASTGGLEIHASLSHQCPPKTGSFETDGQRGNGGRAVPSNEGRYPVTERLRLRHPPRPYSPQRGDPRVLRLRRTLDRPEPRSGCQLAEHGGSRRKGPFPQGHERFGNHPRTGGRDPWIRHRSVFSSGNRPAPTLAKRAPEIERRSSSGVRGLSAPECADDQGVAQPRGLPQR